MSIHMVIAVWTYVFNSLGYILRSGIAESYGNSMLNFLKHLSICPPKRLHHFTVLQGLPRWFTGKESTCQCRRCRRLRFDPWVRKIPLEKKMITHFSILAGITPRTEKPVGLLSLGTQRVRHDLAHTHNEWRVQVPQIFSNTCYCPSFELSASRWGRSCTSLRFWFAFPLWLMMLSISLCAYGWF